MSEQEKSLATIAREAWGASWHNATDINIHPAQAWAEMAEAVAAHVRAPLEARIAALEAALKPTDELRPIVASAIFNSVADCGYDYLKAADAAIAVIVEMRAALKGGAL